MLVVDANELAVLPWIMYDTIVPCKLLPYISPYIHWLMARTDRRGRRVEGIQLGKSGKLVGHDMSVTR